MNFTLVTDLIHIRAYILRRNLTISHDTLIMHSPRLTFRCVMDKTREETVYSIARISSAMHPSIIPNVLLDSKSGGSELRLIYNLWEEQNGLLIFELVLSENGSVPQGLGNPFDAESIEATVETLGNIVRANPLTR